MKVLILGGSGRTGKWLMKEAIERNYQVHALVRKETYQRNGAFPFRNASVRIYTGSPLDTDQLSEAIQDCEAIINTLNISRTSDFPWSPLRTPENFLSEVTKNIIRSAPSHSIKRYITVSAWGTNETLEVIPGWFRWLILNSNIGAAYKDHEKVERLLQASDLDYTILRPVGLTNGTGKKEVVISTDPAIKHKLTVSRKNLATTLLNILEQNSFIRQMPVVSEK